MSLVKLAAILALLYCASDRCFAGSSDEEKTAASQPAAAKVRRIPFKQIGDVTLHLYVHAPSGDPPADGWPAMVFFYGGGWMKANIEQFTPQAEHFARRGMVAIRAEYRVGGRHKATPFEGMADGRAAMRWVRRQAAELKIDPKRIAAAGGSAGGHIATCTAVFPHEGENDSDVSPRPDALILFNPAVDTTETGVGANRFGKRARDGSPLHHLRADLPPTLIMHGTADTTVPFANVQAFRKRMQELGNRCDLVPFEGRVHAFFNPGRSQKDHAATTDAADAFLVSLGWLPKRPGPEREAR